MKLTKRRMAVAGGVAGALVLSGLAFRPNPVSVETAIAFSGPLMTTVDEDARTRVPERYVISSPVTGRQLRIEVKPGDDAKAGHPLVQVEAAPLDPRQMDELRRRLDAAQDLGSEAAASVRRVTALARQAERERARIEELAKTGIASSNERDQTRALSETRRGELLAAQSHARAARHEVEVIRASLEAVAPGNSGVLTLRSPISGRVLAVHRESEGVTPAGMPILEVGDPSSLEVVIDVLSREAPQIVPGQAVIIDGWGGTAPLHGVVTRIEPSAFTKISALGIEEQRVNVIATILDPPRALGDRFEVQAHIVIWSGTALKIPATGVFRDGERWAVFAARGRRARLQHIDVGHRSADQVEVTRGLVAGEAIIIHPSDQVKDGVRITSAKEGS